MASLVELLQSLFGVLIGWAYSLFGHKKRCVERYEQSIQKADHPLAIPRPLSEQAVAGDWLHRFFKIEISADSTDKWMKQEYEFVRSNFFGQKCKIKSEKQTKNKPLETRKLKRKFRIDKVELVFNPSLTRKYLAKEQTMQNQTKVWAWHGTRLSNINGICAKGFLQPNSIWLLLKKTDPGYFGSGIYLSTVAAYSSVYLNFAADGPNVNTQFVMLFCQVLVGKRLELKDLRQFGKPGPAEGYDSHFVLIRKYSNYLESLFNGESPSTDYLPFNKKNFFNWLARKRPDGDEIVVFESAQVLPRYMVTATRIQ